jgi:hypothetical protein
MSGEALRRCIGDVDDFARQQWGREPMIRRAAGDFGDLLDVAAIETMLTDLARRPTFRLVRDGAPVPVGAYTLRTRVGGATLDDVADVDRILDLVADGATIVMQGMQRYWPPLARFCLDVEADLSHPVQANAYLSPPTASGLARHADRHGVIVLQVTGAKEWEIDGVGRTTLHAGDVAYLPAGVHHAARTSGSMSLHITLGLLVRTYRQVLHGLVDDLVDADLDRPLPVGFATDQAAALEDLAEPLRTSLASAAGALGATDPLAVARHEIDRRRRRARRRWTGRLEHVVDPRMLGPDTTVRVRRGITLSRDGEDVLLDVPDRRLRLPALTAPALEVLATDAAVRVGDLPGLAPEDGIVLVRRLVREGVVVVVDAAS